MIKAKEGKNIQNSHLNMSTDYTHSLTEKLQRIVVEFTRTRKY